MLVTPAHQFPMGGVLSVRIGWMTVPERYLEDVRREKCEQDGGSPGVEQLAFAHFLAMGWLDEHLRRTRPVYARRRRRFVERLTTRLPEASIVGASAGLSVSVLLAPDVDMPVLLETARRSRVRVRDLDAYAFAPHGWGNGLVLGYSRIPEAAAAAAVERLAALVR